MTLPDRASGAFVERSLDIDGAPHRYRCSCPPPRPAVAAGDRVLHGSGERGDDGAKPTAVGIGLYIRAHRDTFRHRGVPASAGEQRVERQPRPRVRHARCRHPRIPRRCGAHLSQRAVDGGYGVWDVALRAPDRFAALAPVCGAVEATARRTRHPVRRRGRPRSRSVCGHRATPAQGSGMDLPRREGRPSARRRPSIDRGVRAANAPDARYTRITGRQPQQLGSRVFADAGILDRLFAQKR